MGFVNALALSGLETLKHLQKVFVNFTVVNALAQANSAGGERIPTLVKVAYEPMSPSPMSH